MRHDGLPPDIRQALIDRFDAGCEVVELLDLTVEEVIDAVEDILEERIKEVRQALDIDEEDEDDGGN